MDIRLLCKTARGSLRTERNGLAEAHPVDTFWRWVDGISADLYPPQLAPVAGRHVRGVAAFPAGRGLYAACGWDHATAPPFPYEGLMLVGHHLDAEDVYVERLAAGAANGDPCPGAPRMRFWNMLYRLLDEAEVPRNRIFVTNVHPALIRGDVPTGAIKANGAWVGACGDVLRRQMEVMRPAAVAAMGAAAQSFVSRLLDVQWREVPAAANASIAGSEVSIVAMRHPSAAQSMTARANTARLLREALR